MLAVIAKWIVRIIVDAPGLDMLANREGCKNGTIASAWAKRLVVSGEEAAVTLNIRSTR